VGRAYGRFVSTADCAGLCIVFGFGRVHNGGLPGEELAVGGFHFGDDGGGETFKGRRRGGGELEDGQGGAEFEGGCGIGIVKDFREDVGGAGSEFDGLIVPDERLFAHGEFDFTGEGGGGSAPVADGIAMDADGLRGLRERMAVGEKREDVMLFGGKGGIGGVLRRFGGWGHFGVLSVRRVARGVVDRDGCDGNLAGIGRDDRGKLFFWVV